MPLALAEKAHPAHAEAHLRHAPARKRDRHATIALWLGHETSRTTEIYLHAYLALKERAIQRTAPPSTASGRYRPPDRLLAFLEAL